MEINKIEKYELIDGFAIVDSSFNVINANEEMFRFIGVSGQKCLMDIIHQVDMDDFIDVANNLREDEKSMVLRMRRCDNSYRWMIVNIMRHKYTFSNIEAEYFDLHISDILALKNQNRAMNNTLLDFRHLLAMENELFFTYDYQTGIFCINNFIDHDVARVLETPLNLMNQEITENHYIPEESVAEYQAFCQDMKEGTVSYSHLIKSNFLTQSAEYTTYELKGSTIYSDLQPFKSVGSIKNVDTADRAYSIRTYDYNNTDLLMPYIDVRKYCENNIRHNQECQLTLLLLEIDQLEQYILEERADVVNTLYNTAIQTMKKMVGYRGTVCEIRNNLITIVVKNINTEIDMIAFIDALRSNIKWNLRLIDSKYQVSFSIGIARYPQNGKDLGQVNRKLVKALQIAEERGRNCYIIYREHLHGDTN